MRGGWNADGAGESGLHDQGQAFFSFPRVVPAAFPPLGIPCDGMLIGREALRRVGCGGGHGRAAIRAGNLATGGVFSGLETAALDRKSQPATADLLTVSE